MNIQEISKASEIIDIYNKLQRTQKVLSVILGNDHKLPFTIEISCPYGDNEARSQLVLDMGLFGQSAHSPNNDPQFFEDVKGGLKIIEEAVIKQMQICEEKVKSINFSS